MIVRPAEARDMPALIYMMHQLLAFLKEKGQDLYAVDQDKFENGIVEYLFSQLYQDSKEYAILVGVDDKDWPIGFITGRIAIYHPFFEHRKVAELQFMWPLAPSSFHMSTAFESWGKENGATATSNCATPGNEASVKAILRNGRKLAFHLFFKPLK